MRKKHRKLTLRIFDSHEEADEADRRYWQSQTPAARLRELERLRQQIWGYGNGKPLPRFVRTIRIENMGES